MQKLVLIDIDFGPCFKDGMKMPVETVDSFAKSPSKVFATRTAAVGKQRHTSTDQMGSLALTQARKRKIQRTRIDITDLSVCPQGRFDAAFEIVEIQIFGETAQIAHASVGFSGHRREGDMVQQIIGGGFVACLSAIIFVSPLKTFEVAVHRVLAFDEGFGLVGWTPKVVHITGKSPADRGKLKEGIAFFGFSDQHCNGPCSLGGFTSRSAFITCDIRGDHQGEAFGMLLNPSRGHLKGSGGSVAGVFNLKSAAVWGESQQAVNVDRDGLCGIDAAFGSDDAQSDTFASFRVMLEQSPCSFSSQGDGVFAGAADRHLFAS